MAIEYILPSFSENTSQLLVLDKVLTFPWFKHVHQWFEKLDLGSFWSDPTLLEASSKLLLKKRYWEHKCNSLSRSSSLGRLTDQFFSIKDHPFYETFLGLPIQQLAKSLYLKFSYDTLELR